MLYALIDQISLSDCFLPIEILGTMRILIICYPVCDIINLKLTITLTLSHFSE